MMHQLKQYLQGQGHRKIGISKWLRNVVGDLEKTKNPGPLDIHYLYKYLEQQGFQVSVIGQKGLDGDSEFQGYKWDQVDLNEYDAIIFQPYTFLLFGGVWMPEELAYLDHYTTTFKGETLVIFNDPNIPWENPYSLMINLKRNYLGLEKVPIHREPHWIKDFQGKPTTAIFVGEDYEAYKRLAYTNKITVWPEKVVKIPLSTYIFKNEFAKAEAVVAPKAELFSFGDTEKRYDVCYFGSNRKASRGRYLKKVFGKDEGLKKLWIGYEPEYPNTTFLKKINRDELPTILTDCLTSVVVGDEAHNDNIITYRFFENSLFRVFSVIYDEYDTNRRLIQDEALQKITYFKDIDELNRIIEYLKQNLDRYDEFVDQQRLEIQRLFDQV
jgi:hypothetical protein